MIQNINYESVLDSYENIPTKEIITGITKCDRYNCIKDAITTISINNFVNCVCMYHTVKNQFTNSERIKNKQWSYDS